MSKKFQRYFTALSSPWFLSIATHALLLALIIVYVSHQQLLNKEQQKAEITLRFIPNKPKAPTLTKQKIEQQPEQKIAKPEALKQVKEVATKQEQLQPQQDHNQPRIVEDISYIKNIYQLGSKQNPPPPYPRLAKLRKYEGTVKIEIMVNFRGTVLDAQIQQSSGYKILDEAALKTLKTWQFNIEAATQLALSEERQYKIIVPINFVLS